MDDVQLHVTNRLYNRVTRENLVLRHFVRSFPPQFETLHCSGGIEPLRVQFHHFLEQDDKHKLIKIEQLYKFFFIIFLINQTKQSYHYKTILIIQFYSRQHRIGGLKWSAASTDAHKS